MSFIRDIGESVGSTVLENVGRAMGRAQERTPLPVDLLESEDAYLAVFDAPGTNPSDVQVQYDDGRVEVRIDRFRGFHEGFDMLYPGRGLALDGDVALPPDARVDASAASATLQENGTLEVRVPKVSTAADEEEFETVEPAGDESEAVEPTGDDSTADDATDDSAVDDAAADEPSEDES